MIKRFMISLLIAFVCFCQLITVAAQSETITLEPFADPTIGVSGLVPDGWLQIEPGHFYRDNPIIDNLTQLTYLVVPGMTIDQIIGALPDVIGASEPFESAGTHETTSFVWSLYTTELAAPDGVFVVEVALVETAEATDLVGLVAPSDEAQILREAVLLPALAAFAPVEIITPEPAIGPLPLSYWPTEDWQYTTPEEQGMDSEILAAMIETIREQEYPISSMVIVRHGYIVAEAYFYPANENSFHHVYSVTKSFTSALVGIAIAEGYLTGIDQHVLDFFPEYEFANMDADKEAITIENLLTMSAGFPWNESVPFSSPQNSARQIINYRGDWLQFILDPAMEYPPGTQFVYNSGASHLLSAIIQETTGMTASDYARSRLFEPLGIDRFFWERDTDGRTTGGWGLNLSTREMAKFGLLYLHDGEWDGQQVVPAEWVEASTQGQVSEEYGYQWWLGEDDIFFAAGLYGQYIFVIPHLDMVVAVTSRSVNDSPAIPMSIFYRNIIPAARSAAPLPENPDGVSRLDEQIAAAESS